MPAGSEPSQLPEPFRCEISREDTTATVRAIGELDRATVPVLDDHLAELRDAGFRRLILDLRGLDFIDSTGLRLILDYDSQARNDGSSIALIRGPSAVQRIFELTGTSAQLQFVAG